MINFFRKKKEPEIVKLHSNLSNSFSKIGSDINQIQNWLQHLHEKNAHIEHKHHSHVDLTSKDIDHLKKWIYFLNKHNLEVQGYFKDLSYYLSDLQKKDKELNNRIDELEKKRESDKLLVKGHLGTLERTSQGQLKDMSLELKNQFNDLFLALKKEINEHKDDVETHKSSIIEKLKLHEEKMLEKEKIIDSVLSKNQEDVIDKSELKSNSEISKISKEPIIISEKNVSEKTFVSKSSLSGSQLELLNVLYDSDRPLSYSDLSKILNKKSKSIRNQIYELRDSGIEVKSRFIGLRTKGFYLTKETKIMISGR
jgi:biotin operon repressor